jgi:LysM repeat protein
MMKSMLSGSARQTFPPYRAYSAVLSVGMIISCLFLVSACENRDTAKEIGVLKTKAEQIEKQLEPLRALEQRLVAIEGQADRLDRSLNEMKEQSKILDGHVTRLVQAADQGRKKPAPAPSPAERGKPAPGKAPTAPAAEADEIHTVQYGETLYAIAKAHGISVEELCRLNGLSRDSRIHFGQRLVVPAKKAGTPDVQP